MRTLIAVLVGVSLIAGMICNADGSSTEPSLAETNGFMRAYASPGIVVTEEFNKDGAHWLDSYSLSIRNTISGCRWSLHETEHTELENFPLREGETPQPARPPESLAVLSVRAFHGRELIRGAQPRLYQRTAGNNDISTATADFEMLFQDIALDSIKVVSGTPLFGLGAPMITVFSRDALDLPFASHETAERMAKALKRAATICGARSEVF
jgi:hypothetical protein